MPSTPTASDLIDGELLGIRSRLIDLAATLDRIDRAEGAVADDPRLATIRQCLGVIADTKPGRAEQLQLLFSLPYKDDWKSQYDL